MTKALTIRNRRKMFSRRPSSMHRIGLPELGHLLFKQILNKRPVLARSAIRAPQRKRTRAILDTKYNYRGGKRLKRTKLKVNFEKSGYIRHTETGGEVTDTDCVYTGHGCAARQVCHVVAGALIRSICRKIGIQMLHPEDRFQPNTSAVGIIGRFNIFWKQTAHGAMLGAQIDIGANDINRTIVDNVADSLEAIFNQAGILMTMNLTRYTGPGGVQPADAVWSDAQLDLTTCNVHFRFVSHMLIQNRTKASSDALQDDTTNVERNPITGAFYVVNSNGFVERQTNNITGPTNSFELTADQTNGFVGIDRDDANRNTNMQNWLKHPPNKSYFRGVQQYSKITIQPGTIKKYSIARDYVKNINQLSRLMQGTFTEKRCNSFGKSQMFATELLCDSRVVTEPSVSVGYEIKQQYYAAVTFKNQKLSREHIIY